MKMSVSAVIATMAIRSERYGSAERKAGKGVFLRSAGSTPTLRLSLSVRVRPTKPGRKAKAERGERRRGEAAADEKSALRDAVVAAGVAEDVG